MKTNELWISTATWTTYKHNVERKKTNKNIYIKCPYINLSETDSN